MFSPFKDMAFVLLTPLPILLAFAAARRGGWMDGLLTFGLALAMAHYLPGILRAYGDGALFRRYRLRLVFAPLFLISITTWFAYRNLHIVIFLALLWGHVARRTGSIRWTCAAHVLFDFSGLGARLYVGG